MNRTAVIVLGIVAVVILIAVVIGSMSGGAFVLRTIDFVAASLVNVSGMGQSLARGLVILATIPFFWAVAVYTRRVFWFKPLKPSLKLYLNPHGIIIVAYVGAYFLAMAYASRGNYFEHTKGPSSKWCAESPEGIRVFDSPGVDPVYGLELKPCTYEQIVSLKRAEIGLKGPSAIEVADPRELEFFDSISGSPKVWYRRLPGGSFRLFDRPGKDPTSGEALQPIDKAVVGEVVAAYERNKAAGEAASVRKVEEERDRKRRDAAERFVNAGMVDAVRPAKLAILVFREDGGGFPQLEDSVGNVVSAHGVEAIHHLFKPSFAKEGRARALLEGDWKQAADVGLTSWAGQLILGQARLSDETSQPFEDVRTVRLQLEVKWLDLAGRTVKRSETLASQGAGFTEDEALSNAVGRLQPALEAFLKDLH